MGIDSNGRLVLGTRIGLGSGAKSHLRAFLRSRGIPSVEDTDGEEVYPIEEAGIYDLIQEAAQELRKTTHFTVDWAAQTFDQPMEDVTVFIMRSQALRGGEGIWENALTLGCTYGSGEFAIQKRIGEIDIHVLRIVWPEFKLITPDDEYLPDVTITLNIDYIPNDYLESECEKGHISTKDKEETRQQRERRNYDVRIYF